MAAGGVGVKAVPRARGLVWLAAALIAVATPVLAYAAAEAWLARSAQAFVGGKAEMILERIDSAVDRAVLSLREARKTDIAACDWSALQTLRLMVFESPVLKELAVIGPDGGIRCNDIGSLAAISPASTPFPTHIPDLSMAVAAARGPYGRALRLMLHGPDGPTVGGLVAVGLFIPQRLLQTADVGLGIEMELVPGGRLVSVRGPGAVEGSAQIAAARRSLRYPVEVRATASEGAWRRQNDWVVTASVSSGAVLGLLLAGLNLYCRRERGPVAEMYRALRNGEFVPHYQPLIDIDTGRILGCEVLARWRKPDGTMIPPGAFIGEAEQSGFIFPLTLALMRQAVEDLGPTYAARPDLKCSFNLCAAHFRDKRIIGEVVSIFSNGELRLSQVLLEVTERDPLPDMDAARAIIARFQELGVRVALDDVGTGHGGMSYLLKLRVDVMKIDKIFIDALGAERQSTAIVDSLIDLAAHLNMEVIAEGVETFEQVEALRRRGVRSAQGYVFAPPLPASSYCQLVEAMEPAATVQEPERKALRV